MCCTRHVHLAYFTLTTLACCISICQNLIPIEKRGLTKRSMTLLNCASRTGFSMYLPISDESITSHFLKKKKLKKNNINYKKNKKNSNDFENVAHHPKTLWNRADTLIPHCYYWQKVLGAKVKNNNKYFKTFSPSFIWCKVFPLRFHVVAQFFSLANV